MEEFLQNISALRKDREAAAAMAMERAAHFQQLLQCALSTNPEIAVKSCWILEIVLLQHPECIHANRDRLFKIFNTLQQGSGIRPLAKIIAHWTEDVFTTQTNRYPGLSAQETDSLTEVTFNWLLSDHPVAVKVFSMESLYHLGKKNTWVHEELRVHLQRNYPDSKPAYRARARKILEAL